MTGRRSSPPATIAQATALLAHYGEVDAQLAEIEATRKAELGRVNASADAAAAPLIAELEALAQRLQPWWDEAGAAIAKGKKAVQLGGCKIGYRTSRPMLEHGFPNEDAAVEALRTLRAAGLFKQTTRVRYALDRTATAKLIQIKGKAAEHLGKLGFRVEQSEIFFVERVEQPGTIGAGA